MAEVTVSVVLERVRGLMEEQKLLRGTAKELVISISEVLKEIIHVLYDAERRSFKEEAVEGWLSRLERMCHDFEDVLDEWDYALLKLKKHEWSDVAPRNQKVRSLTTSSWLYFTNFGVRRNLAKKIRNVKAQLDIISGEREKYKFVVPKPTAIHTLQVQSTSSIHEEEVYGRDHDREFLVDVLVASEHEPQVLSLVGMAGIGKTTLAQLVFNDSRVNACFELRKWIYVSNALDVVGIAKQIIESIGKFMITNKLDLVFEQLRDSISRKKILLVLDDVMTEDSAKWEPLFQTVRYGGADGSKILVTSNLRAEWMFGPNLIVNVDPLSNEDCWLILRNTALLGSNGEKPIIFEDIGMKMAEKCRGLPSAAKTLGSFLLFKNTVKEWEDVLHEEIWELVPIGNIQPHLLLSYNDLSPILKHCFSYCSIFPEDSWIEVEKLIEIWIALGYFSGTSAESGGDMETGEKNFDMLAMRSWFQDFKRSSDGKIKRCIMNSIMHDFSRYLRKRRIVDTKNTHCHICTPSSISQVKAYHSLFWDNDSPLTICNCLRSVRVLRMRCMSSSIPQGVENLINLRWLELRGKKLSREEAKIICKLYKLQFLRFYVQEIPREIENCVHLTLLDLSFNDSLEELPESICNLHELRTLNIKFCRKLSKLPKGIDNLKKLEHLLNLGTSCLKQFPERIARMTWLRTLNEYCVGDHWSMLEWLDDLNQLSGFLILKIRFGAGDSLHHFSWKGNMKSKEHVEELQIIFEDEMGSDQELNILTWYSLGPLVNLKKLTIWFFKGTYLQPWIWHKLTSIKLYSFNVLSTLPHFNTLPCLEEIYISEMHGLKIVRLPNLESLYSGYVAFPRLKELVFNHCPAWEVWEDISKEEEEYENLSIMPRLKKLTIIGCPSLRALPHRLLGKLPSAFELNVICCSTDLPNDAAAAAAWNRKSNPHNIASTSQPEPS